MTIACTFSQINLLSCRFSLPYAHWQWHNPRSGAVRGNFMRDPDGQVRKGSNMRYVRMAPIANWPQNQAPGSPNQQERELNQKQNVDRKVVNHFCPRPGSARPGRHIAHWFYLLIRTLCCFYLIFMPGAIFISVIELSLSRQPAGKSLLLLLCYAWLALVGQPVGSSPGVQLVLLSTRSHVEPCQKWFCAWLALANTQRYTKWWTSASTPKPKLTPTTTRMLDMAMKRVADEVWARKGKLEVAIHWQIGAIEAGAELPTHNMK